DGRGCYPKCHAERAVYQLRERPHEEEEQPGLGHASPCNSLPAQITTESDYSAGPGAKFGDGDQSEDRRASRTRVRARVPAPRRKLRRVTFGEAQFTSMPAAGQNR